jgi:SAM-dependent methyltransferase
MRAPRAPGRVRCVTGHLLPMGFADADASADPAGLTAYLDALAALPAVAAAKRRRDRMLAFPGAHVLDLGCGTGDDLRAMARLAGPRGRAVGIDASAALLAVARRRIDVGDGPVELLRADAAALPLADESFDGVRAERLLQHVPDPRGVIAEAFRVLRPGGRLLAADTDWGMLALDLEPAATATAVARAVAGAVPHPWAGRSLRRWLLAAGLVGVEVRADTYAVTDPRALGAADPLRRLGEAAPEALAAVEAAVAAGRFLAALTVFEATGRRPAGG